MLKPGVRNIAYGASDFEDIRQKNDYYVDKTRFIPVLEQNRYLFFIRPRRFGKSLWASILETYYDIAKKDQFEKFFNGLWVGEHPTEERNSYLILKFNFSAVRADMEWVEQSFEEYGIGVLNWFLRSYTSCFTEDSMREIQEISGFVSRLNRILQTCNKLNLPVYVIIDEYDNFANTILSTAGTQAYHSLTHGEGFFRNFFTVLKEGTSHSGSGLKRLFITGV
ncbi:MAG: AAA family ATPase, partial [SAR324 cluster bacterium]|nr:AAA family ATPase [SAR324 cluster bacterium]